MSLTLTHRLTFLSIFIGLFAALGVSQGQGSGSSRSAAGSSNSITNGDSTVQLLDPTFTSERPGGAVAPLQVGSHTPYTGTLDKNYFGIYVDIDRSGDNSYFQTSGIRTWTNYSGSSADYPIATGGEFITSNNNATGGTHMLQGVEGWATCNTDCYEVQGATGFANSTTGANVTNTRGGIFFSGTNGNVHDQVGVLAMTSPAGNGTTVSNSTAFRGTLMRSGSATVVNGYGLNLSGWSGNGFLNTVGIYADASIDRGTSSRYFIKSLSTSPSLLSGDLTVGGRGKFAISTPQTPAGSSDACTTGQMAWDTNFVYVCVASNTWKRMPLAIW